MKLFNIVLGSALVFFIVMFLRCEKVTEITELTKNTESLQIVFYNDSIPNKIVEVTDKSEIKKIGKFISDKDTPLYKCSYDGQIIFVLNNDVAIGKKNTITMEFNLQPDCTHVAYMYAEGLRTKELSEEGVEYLKKVNGE